MKLIAAYLLPFLAKNSSPSAADLKNILGSVGAEVDDEMLKLLLNQVEGKDVTELIAFRRKKLASVPFGGGATYSAVAAALAFGGGVATVAAAPAEEPNKEEKAEESDDDMGFSLFD